MRGTPAVLAALALALTAGRPHPAPAQDGALVRVIVHVPLAAPRARPGATVPWYCAPGRAHDDAPTPVRLLAEYARTLGRYGPVHDRFGLGTWTIGRGDAPDVAFEADDHLDAIMPLRAARVVLPPLLRRLRADLRQREALGEIVGAEGPPGETRTHVAVVVPFARAGAATIARLHVIFGNRGDGGASQDDDADGVHVSSGVVRTDLPRIEAELRGAGFRYATEPEAFVTVDAPAC